MKAEVHKTVEVVLRMTEAEALHLMELMRCIRVTSTGRVEVTHQPEPGEVFYALDETVFNALLELLEGLP